jgi:predicted AlkP superfamily pyrophosphatase or phosphodiesterase
MHERNGILYISGKKELAMAFETFRGRVLQDIPGAFQQKNPKGVLMFIIDGCRADTLYVAIDSGAMPNLKRLMEEVGFARYDNCITSFPSVTISTHSSIITGAYPGLHGIVGNDWFIRKQWGLFPDAQQSKRKEFYKVTREYVKMSFDYSDPGLANLTGKYFEIANNDLYNVKTIYEAVQSMEPRSSGKPSSVAIYEMITRGAGKKEPIFIDDLTGAAGGRILGLFNAVRKIFTRKEYLACDDKGLDRSAFGELTENIDGAKNGGIPLSVVWLPGLDGFSHKNGASKQKEYFRKGDVFTNLFAGNMDNEFGKLRSFLKKNGLLDDVLIIITADHGQYDCGQTHYVSNEQIYRELKNNPSIVQGEKLPVTSDGKIDENCKDASIVAIGNGGACYLYIKSAMGWNSPPDQNRLGQLLPFFENLEATDKMFVRSPDGKTFRLWSKGNYSPISSLDPDRYPLAEERVNNLGITLRSGDIILSAKKGYYFAGKKMNGEHGTLGLEDSRVPLVFINRQLRNKRKIVTTVRTIDIAPTIATVTGCMQSLLTDRKIKEKLSTILDSLESLALLADAYPAIKKEIKALNLDTVLKTVALEKEDAQSNFEIKLEHYSKTGEISAEEHQKLKERYDGIKAKLDRQKWYGR